MSKILDEHTVMKITNHYDETISYMSYKNLLEIEDGESETKDYFNKRGNKVLEWRWEKRGSKGSRKRVVAKPAKKRQQDFENLGVT